MEIKMNSTRWITPVGTQLIHAKKDGVYDVSRYCAYELIAYGYAEKVVADKAEWEEAGRAFNAIMEGAK